jgi:predicted GNAT family acetyltransferase
VTDEPRVFDNAADQRYELHVGDQLAGTITYRSRPDAIVLIHTEVDPSLEGQGLGSRLVRGALSDIRDRGLKVVPKCRFVRAYLRRHPDEADLV